MFDKNIFFFKYGETKKELTIISKNLDDEYSKGFQRRITLISLYDFSAEERRTKGIADLIATHEQEVSSKALYW